jgi:hypothetical protein
VSHLCNPQVATSTHETSRRRIRRFAVALLVGVSQRAIRAIDGKALVTAP